MHQGFSIYVEPIEDKRQADLGHGLCDEIRSVIGFIRRKQGDVDTIAPSLFLGRTTAKKKDNGDKTQTPATTVPVATQPAAPVNNATSIANVAPVANAQVAATGPYIQ